jgi:ribosomal protein S18 acetylase RimI-like enzyme
MRPVIEVLAADDIDCLEPLWVQLLAHHSRGAPHLAELGAVRSPADSWQLRRAEYSLWLSEPRARAFVARDGDDVLGYAMVRVVTARGSWQWGDQVGVLETLVVDAGARGAGIGQAMLALAREHLAALGIGVMKISVIAGNDGATRFYQRAGAVAYEQTLVMPVAD